MGVAAACSGVLATGFPRRDVLGGKEKREEGSVAER